jgi:hypothetical protein
MNAVTPIILVLLGLGSFFIFRWFSRKVVRKQHQDRQVRLARISSASMLFQVAIGIIIILGFYSMLAFLLGWPFFAQNHVRVVVSQNHVYSAPADMPPALLALWLVKTGLGLGCAMVLFALFGLYRRGVLFAARNVSYIRFLGYWLMIDWFIDDQMQATFHDMALSTTPLFIGLLIIFVAWIMDEGRKIQEEQELTV